MIGEAEALGLITIHCYNSAVIVDQNQDSNSANYFNHWDPDRSTKGTPKQGK